MPASQLLQMLCVERPEQSCKALDLGQAPDSRDSSRAGPGDQRCLKFL